MYTHKGEWSVVMSFPGFGIKTLLASWKELGSVPSSSVFFLEEFLKNRN